ncbi:MAG: ABC transporter permease, partial [Clostridiales bacterium]|nr:ABC transporter permease [Clostridiales bacterium]
MFRYICKRMVYLLITLLIILTTTFFLMKKLPGTPFDSERFSLLPADQQAQLLEKYGLNDPVIVQYGKYILNVAKGDFGTSFFYSGQPVSGVIMGRIGPSALIGIQAILIGLSIGLILGIIAAWRHNSGIDYFTMVIAVLGVSVPNFVAAALLQYYVGLK